MNKTSSSSIISASVSTREWVIGCFFSSRWHEALTRLAARLSASATNVAGLSAVFFEFLLLVFGAFVLAAFMPFGRPRRSELAPRPPLDFLTGSELFLPGWTHPASSPCFPGPRATRLAEVCRNRTDRSTVGRPAGFEVPDGHQPACTSMLILRNFLWRVNLALLGCCENRR